MTVRRVTQALLSEMKILVDDIIKGTARLLHVAEIPEKRTSRVEDE